MAVAVNRHRVSLLLQLRRCATMGGGL